MKLKIFKILFYYDEPIIMSAGDGDKKFIVMRIPPTPEGHDLIVAEVTTERFESVMRSETSYNDVFEKPDTGVIYLAIDDGKHITTQGDAIHQDDIIEDWKCNGEVYRYDV